jgi:type I restriction-modification system DNA methylase subunit
MTTARNQTTAQSLGALFKSARDILRKDQGLKGDLDRLPMLTWIYESMLREMRDAVGDSGEFYTPRAVVRLMVAVTDPRLGETVLDPASGTGGFLVEAYNHLSKQIKTVADRRVLQERSLFGCEPKTLPHLREARGPFPGFALGTVQPGGGCGWPPTRPRRSISPN